MADKVEVQELDSRMAMNALSREKGVGYICSICGKAEAYQNYLDMTFEMCRIALEQDYQEAKRLPPGMRYGTLYPFPTGGLTEVQHHEGGYDNERME